LNEEFYDIHFEKAEQICAALDLPQDIAILSYDLWGALLMKVPRTPVRLLCDCIYVVAHMTGNRRSVNLLADTAKNITGFRVRVMSKDKRRRGTRWIQTAEIQPIVLGVIPDKEALDLLLSEYPAPPLEEGES
jgi:hypothetical protein